MKPKRRKPRILCVDDDKTLLEGLKLSLRKEFKVFTAESVGPALAMLQSQGPFAAVISDMRMPAMNGAQLLTLLRQRAPETVRILLTGFSDIESFTQAVNGGGVYKILSKPCEPEQLRSALREAVVEHDLRTVRASAVAGGLSGLARAASETLSTLDPGRSARFQRVLRKSIALCRRVNLSTFELEVAVAVLGLGEFLASQADQDDTAMGYKETGVDRALALVSRLPGSCAVAKVLSLSEQPYDELKTLEEEPQLKLKANILALAGELALANDGALGANFAPPGQYAAELLGQLNHMNQSALDGETRRLSVKQLETGMMIAEDVKTVDGTLLVRAGQDVTYAMVAQLSKYEATRINREIQVLAPLSELSALDR